MFCEIEFMAVGEGSRAGDAIVIRYGQPNDFKLMLVDGGTAETGETLVRHLKEQFGDQVWLEHVVVTHSDADHASGIRKVLEALPVSNLWLHVPWVNAGEALNLFKNKNLTQQGLEAAIRDKYDIINEIFQIALKKPGISIYQPFQGMQIGPFTVMSPNKATYLHLLPQFDRTPDPDQELLESRKIWIGKPQPTLLQALFDEVKKKVAKWIPETWFGETLRDDVQTSASNESSVILYGQFEENRRVLLTGDAGINALTWAASYATSIRLPLQQFTFVQVPHHGSKHNVGPTVLNQLIGPVQREGTPSRFVAYVSAPKEDDQHPRRIVLNAFIRRGARVFATQGVNTVYSGGFPVRNGYSAVDPKAFSNQVESYDD